MLNFEFQNPTRIVFGKDTVPSLDKLVPADARVLILYGGQSAERTGTLAEVRAALGTRLYREFGGIEPNPTFETLMKAVDLVRAEKIDFLLTLGGGSVIDGSKFVAAAANFTGDPWQILESFGAVVKQALPLGVVLTLSATGSEMNSGAVVTRKATHTKAFFSSPLVFPVFAILDPTKTFSLPPQQLAKRAKLLQYAERVWQITIGSDDERIDLAILKTQDFFERLGVKTRLSGYGLGPDAVDALVNALETHGMTKLGEHGEVDLAMSRRAFEAAL